MAFEWDNIIKLTMFGFGILLGLSLLLSQVFGIETVKGGPILLIFVIMSAILLIWNLATKKNFDFDKSDIIALILVSAMIFGMFIVLPQAVPQLFSTLSVFGP